jgi:AraC-like DNA-binding protein
MRDTSQDLFIGATDTAPNCTPDTGEQNIWSKFMLMVFLQGRQHFVIDNTHFRIDAGEGKTRCPTVFMLNVARPSKLQFIVESDTPLHKVMIAAPHPWLTRLTATADGKSARFMSDFFSEHLAHFSFEPGRYILQLAKKIMSPPPLLEGELNSLYLKANALDIMWQSCLALKSKGTEDRQAPVLNSLRRYERLRDFIVANLDRQLTIDLIAREASASAATVQRHFKEHFGITIFDFIRQKRLEAARAALANDGVPVTHAAHIAGYNSVSNFTTAFRKAYGLTPKRARS